MATFLPNLDLWFVRNHTLPLFCIRDPEQLRPFPFFFLRPPQTWLHPRAVEKENGGSNLNDFPQDWRVHCAAVCDCSCTYTWHRAAMAAGQQDILSEHDCLILLLLLLSVSLCVGEWRAHPGGAAKYLLGSSPTNKTSDVWWQWKISTQQV